jgi:hypothetical protein
MMMIILKVIISTQLSSSRLASYMCIIIQIKYWFIKIYDLLEKKKTEFILSFKSFKFK